MGEKFNKKNYLVEIRKFNCFIKTLNEFEIFIGLF